MGSYDESVELMFTAALYAMFATIVSVSASNCAYSKLVLTGIAPINSCMISKRSFLFSGMNGAFTMVRPITTSRATPGASSVINEPAIANTVAPFLSNCPKISIAPCVSRFSTSVSSICTWASGLAAVICSTNKSTSAGLNAGTLKPTPLRPDMRVSSGSTSPSR